MPYPMIIQGGMGAGVSDWRLARAVARTGQLGVVSGTALDQIFIRRLQLGDPGGHLREALSHFPDQQMAQTILESFFIPQGKHENRPFKMIPMLTLHPDKSRIAIIVAAAFADVFLAKQEHSGKIGINLLEKIQLPNLFSLYGAMLAGVDCVIMGAGIPVEVPGILDRLSRHQAATMKIDVLGASPDDNFHMELNPADFFTGNLPDIKRPEFLCIVSSDVLAKMMMRKASGTVNGFIVEGPSAGGHNAPPRGRLKLSQNNEPVYHDRDLADLEKIKGLGLPFWLAGSYGSPDRLKEALAVGASGIQVGSAFAVTEESGFAEDIKTKIRKSILSRSATVYTDPFASPTGFPFKILSLSGTLSEEDEYQKRPRVCNLGYLRHLYKKEDGTVGYRCPAEPEAAYIKKGGRPEDTHNKKCLCNALLANLGLSQPLPNKNEMEKELVTFGDNTSFIADMMGNGQNSCSASQVVEYLLQKI